MSFTYPIFLWGLSALVIPVIVHLFNFRKAKRVSFSNVRFLESIKKKSSSNLKLKHLLILLCRLLFVFFLILTFAQPYIPGSEKGLQSNSVKLYLDNSNSLSNLTENDNSGFNELLDIAQKVVNLYPQETKFNLITNEFSPGQNIGQSKTKTLERLTEIEFSNLARKGEEVFSKLTSIEPSMPGDIFILSDFQKSTFGEFDEVVDSLNNYHMVVVNTPDQKNISVDTIFLTNPFLIPNQKNTIQVKLKNQGSLVNDLQVKFFINGNQSATSSVDIEANSSQNITFELTGSLSSINRCLISFEDFPITFDNDYYFTLNQASQIDIVEISDHENSPVSKVYQNNDLFHFESFSSESISYPSLDRADLIIINELTSLDNGLKAQVEKHLEDGKTTILIPNEDSFQNYRLSNVEITKDSTKTISPISVPDLKNPFFKNIFESIKSDTQMPEAATTHRWKNNDIKLLKTKTGQTFLSHLFQSGNLFVFSGPITSPFTNFYQHALFVPVMHRIAELSSTNSQALAFTIDETNLTLAVDSVPNDQLYKLKKEEVELIPSQRVTANELILDMPKYLVSLGFYDLTLGNQSLTAIAFNHSKTESNLGTLEVEEIKARLAGIKHLNIYQPQDADTFFKEMKETYHRRELWKYTLILSLIFLFAESALLRFL